MDHDPLAEATEKARLWGRWWPLPSDTEPVDGTWLEWWPSQLAAEQALRERLGTQPATIDGIARSTMRLADGRTLTDQQFYGNHRSRIYLYDVTGEPGHTPEPAAEPYSMLHFDQAGDIVLRDLAGAHPTTVHVEIVHQESGRGLCERDVVVYPWDIDAFGFTAHPQTWNRWLDHTARDLLRIALDIMVPGPFHATATHSDTGQRTTVVLSGLYDPEPTR
ncbi:hypothetical protein ACIQC7_34785 [Kitasatospora sp. NPDC088556]|uniref:hypothetical protein n=1 Tax=Kitasatospora sp. NPDC088556 TaxID=3364076 RepID=UPI0037FA2FC9